MLVQLNQVSKQYGRDKILNNVTMTFVPGKFYGLIGPNGSGKSTALKLIAGLASPDSGAVQIGETHASRRMCRSVSYLPELDMIYPGMTLEQLLTFYESQFEDFDTVKARKLAEELKVHTNKKMLHLSKGGRGRVKLILAMARTAPILLLDEPLSGLDPLIRESIVQSLLKYIDLEKQTVIMATHEIAEIEALLDEVAAIYKGELIGMEAAEHIRETEGISIVEWFKQTVMFHEQKEMNK